MRRATLAFGWGIVGVAVLFVAVQGFAWHSLSRGAGALLGNPEAQGRLAGSLLSSSFVFGHMITGAGVTVLAVVQSAGFIRKRWPVVHRFSGRALSLLALLTGVAGLGYIVLRSSIGGPIMNIGFGLYGVLICIAAVQAPRFAMAGDMQRHRRWGMRLIVLALGSWIYRVHYGIWYGTTCTIGPQTCGIGAAADFSGVFDIIQVFAFYLPYLIVLEWMLRRNPNPKLL